MNNKILIIAKKEYLERVRKKSFIILTILIPLLLGLLMVLPMLMMQIKTSVDKIAVVDDSQLLAQSLKSTKSIEFQVIEMSLETIKKEYKDMGFDGVLYIPDIDINRPMGVRYYSKNQLGMSTMSHIRRSLEKLIEDIRYKESGLDRKAIEKLRVRLDIESIVLSAEGEKTASMLASMISSQLMGFIIYFVLLMYGTMIMKGVIDEKKNRIVEIIVSTVKPFQLMMGKIFGITAVALTQLFIWIILIGIIGSMVYAIYLPDIATISQTMAQKSMIQSSAMGQMDPMAGQDLSKVQEIMLGFSKLNYPLIIICFIFFFTFGYLTYAAMFAAVGSIVGDENDNQAVTLPVTIPVILAMVIMMNVMQNPDSTLAVWSSMFPLFSPIVMMARIPYGVPYWQIILSISILIATFIGTTWMAGRIYRTGILLYGKKITFKEIFKWLSYKD